MRKNLFILLVGCFISCGSINCTIITTNTTPVISPLKKTDLAEFPKGYEDWSNTVSCVNLDRASDFYGFQRVLVNEDALPAYKDRGAYPEGSRLVLEFSRPIAETKTILKGELDWLAVMTRSLEPEALKTGGWIFSAFEGKTKALKTIDPVKDCYQCHMGAWDRSYVFSSPPQTK